VRNNLAVAANGDLSANGNALGAVADLTRDGTYDSDDTAEVFDVVTEFPYVYLDSNSNFKRIHSGEDDISGLDLTLADL